MKEKSHKRVRTGAQASQPVDRRVRRGQSGQAMIEFCIGALVLLLLVTGIIHVGRMARISLSLHAEIRADAGQTAMQSTLGTTPQAISDWDSGADGLRFTADDKPQLNSVSAMGILDAVVSHSVSKEEDWQVIVDKTRRPTSMARLRSQTGMTAFLGFVHKEQAVDMMVDPFIREMVYDAAEIRIKEEVWMPQMGGLF